mmetsp:Transcript_369/g.745  ORF Transcript_369/g.745 Transcript_369/m.745 type:complete len:197 (+) Transcript_369:105-695(+)
MLMYNNGMVTNEEVVDAQARHAQALSDLNPGAGPATRGQLQALLISIHDLLAKLDDKVGNLDNKVGNLDRKMSAISENSRFFQRNSQSIRMSGGNQTLWRPKKTEAGFAAAPPLPEMAPVGAPPAAVQQVFNAPAPFPGPNTVPPASLAFPATTGQTISRADLGYFARWYNEDFGIAAGDNHDMQIKKFRDFLSGL